jgi:thiopeptide-type bacteriocin biosynthesis protein
MRPDERSQRPLLSTPTAAADPAEPSRHATQGTGRADDTEHCVSADSAAPAGPSRPTPVVVGDRPLSMAEFLIRCANSLGDGIGDPRQAFGRSFVQSRDVFLDGGLAALRLMAAADCDWVHVGLQLPSGAPTAELYRRLAVHARDQLAQTAASNFFFLHKPPGLRVRFEATRSDRPRLEREQDLLFAAWQRQGLLDGIVSAVYEPEAHLFGGPVSMRCVHRLFTIDALAWLDVHALDGGSGRQAGPHWAISLVMLRALFDGLGIVGWEDLDVWDRIRGKTGRQLGGQALAHRGYAQVADQLRAGWRDHDRLRRELPSAVREITDAYRNAVIAEAELWRREYFATRHAYIGPREAAAYFTVFHWNRAGLSSVRQALVTEALAGQHAA